MAAPVTDRIAQLGYVKARRILLVAGLAVLLVVAAVTYARRVDGIEVTATLLFVPVFLALLYRGALGGIAAGVIASIVYALLRGPAIDAVGFGQFAGLIASRSAAYLLFGAFGGWSNQTLESSLEKLELYDQIDDATGLNNARYFLQQTDLEVARARRYQTLFSVALLQIPAAPIAALPRRRRGALLRELGRQMRESVRTVDFVVHGRLGERHLLAAILPETGQEGAEVFRHRFEDRVRQFLVARDVAVDEGDLHASAFTYPDSEEGLAAARADFAQIDEIEHAHHEPAA
jgi:GGDEF domain-containing protein